MLNDKGQNSSGLIIDEGNYFAGSGVQVNDDFSDVDGPHGVQTPPSNG